MKEQEKLVYTEYLSETRRTGGSTKHVTYSMKIFFHYLKDAGLSLFMLKIRHAQDFQVYLTTSTNEDGSMRFTRASVLNIVGSVSNFYEYLRKKKYIHANPFSELDRVRRSDALPRNILSEANMDIFLKHLKAFMNGRTLTEKRQLYKAHVIGELMYSTGMRVNEVASLKEKDIDFYRGIVTVHDSKTGKKREAILNSFAEKVMALYINDMRPFVMFGKNKADTSLLFGAKTNLRTWLNEILNRESQKLGFGKFTTHNFRHAVGYHLLRGGCDIRFIQEILGHEALHSTQVYTRVDKEDLKNVIDSYHPRKLKGHQ
jgi:site-specific recombinase XerD